jgi:hypothetical protein
MTERETHLATLKSYQAWRTGEDDRLYDERGLTPQAITAAIDWAIADIEARPFPLTPDQSTKAHVITQLDKLQRSLHSELHLIKIAKEGKNNA